MSPADPPTAANENKEVRVAIVGCGQIVTHHVEALCSKKNAFRVKALCDPNPERRRVIQRQVQELDSNNDSNQDNFINEYNTLEELRDDTETCDNIDLILIAVPHDLHQALALQALTLTPPKWVVLEKPLAPTADACRRLVQASLDHNCRLLVAEQSPYWPAVVAARQALKQGQIGTLVTAASYYYESMRDNITSGSVEEGGGLGWRGSLQRAGGGIALDGGLHWIRPLRELCGRRVQSVVGVVRAGLQPALQMEGESLGHALLEMEPQPHENDNDSGVGTTNPNTPLVATYSCHMLATAPMAHDACPYFRLTGTNGELVILGTGLQKHVPGAGGLRLYNAQYPDGHDLLSADQVGGFFLGFSGLWQHMAHELLLPENHQLRHESVVRAADDVSVVLALYKSSQTRQWETTTL